MSRHPARQMLVWALAVIMQDKCWSGHLPSSCKTNAGLGTSRHPAGQMLVWALAVILQDKCWSGHLPSSSQANTGWSSSFIQVEFNRLETFTFGDTSVRCVRGFWCSGLICYARTFIPICPISFMNRYYKKNPLGRHCRRGNC